MTIISTTEFRYIQLFVEMNDSECLVNKDIDGSDNEIFDGIVTSTHHHAEWDEKLNNSVVVEREQLLQF